MDNKISQKNSYGTHVNQYRNLNKQVDPEIIIRINVYTKILCRKLENTTDLQSSRIKDGWCEDSLLGAQGFLDLLDRLLIPPKRGVDLRAACQ